MELVWARVWNLTLWALQGLLAALFLIFGASKFAPHVAYWSDLFGRIGLGYWLQSSTGAVEIVCAVLLLVPSVSAFAAAVLACTMTGAALIHVLVLHDGAWFFPALPLLLLSPVVVSRWPRRS